MTNNVFKGPDSVAQYFDPDCNPPLPLVEIPDRLNPYRQDGVRIYAKMLTALPAQNVKSLPALNMLKDKAPDAATQAIVEASSGSTVLSLGIISNVLWGNSNVTAHVTNKKHKDSLKMLRFFGLQISLYGGLAQQEPTDPRGIMNRLRELAKSDENVCYPGQYDNANNWKAHERWTGPQTLKQLPEINIFCTTVGTGGTGAYLKAQKPSVKVLGVFNVFGDPTPGPRHLHGFKSCGFPWKSTVDTYTEVKSEDSYRMSMRLSREGLIAGPSSGEALQGLLDYIGDVKATGKLSDLADPQTGEISCVFTCSDLPYQYLDGYFTKLGEDEFPPIHNEFIISSLKTDDWAFQILLSCDQDKHDERWILDTKQALNLIAGEGQSSTSEFEHEGKARIPVTRCASHTVTSRKRGFAARLKSVFNCASPKSQKPLSCREDRLNAEAATRPLIIDLRDAATFQKEHVAGAHAVTLEGLTPKTANGDLFGDANAVHWAWSRLRELFDSKETAELLKAAQSSGREVIVVCYDGDASRLATSILRSRGIAASSIEGGWNGLKEILSPPSNEPKSHAVKISTTTINA
ncbi:Cysteine synthase K/M:Cysteine synthase B [Paramyrothecium foliicola]|nr:Cysteine synthase K/M:Cysteine synthase B [Paramyrothecium foliicola]